MPKVEQYNLQNRWAWMGDQYVFQAFVKAMKEDRTSSHLHVDNSVGGFVGRYVGGENMTNFKQKNPIIGASDPWGTNFDLTMIWGSVHGSMYYVGFRFNWDRN